MRFVAILALLAGSAWSANSGDPSPSQIEDIIAKFAAKEAEFQKARGNYTYRQSAKIQELDDMGQAHGKWEMVSDIIFTPEGRRTERVVYSPVPSLEHILLSPADEQDLRDVQPFVLTTNELSNYFIRYLGR